MDSIFSVSELTGRINHSLEKDFPFVWVRGEVSNFSRSASGHIYFSLKDTGAQLNCVWFLHKRKKSSASGKFDPLTGEVYKTPRPHPDEILQNGLEILCAGSIGVYAGRGQYQLLVDLVELSGFGTLALAFEALKASLNTKGYFNQEHKKQLPSNPLRVALITSPHGAAIHDFLKLGGERGLSSRIRLFPVPVQGEGAAEKIALAINLANSQNWAEVVVVIRGGGSLEDLWAFNEEVVADAIYNSALPVLTGIGHDVDTSIADLVADKRAATPSHAAQLLWPMRRDLWQKLDDLRTALDQSQKLRIQSSCRYLEQIEKTLAFFSPVQKIAQKRQRLSEINSLLGARIRHLLDVEENKLNLLIMRQNSEKNIKRKIDFIEDKLRSADKLFYASYARIVNATADKLGFNTFNLRIKMRAFLEIKTVLYSEKTAILKSLDPAAPLRRGFVLMYGNKGIILSAKSCNPGDKLKIHMQDGTLTATVDKIENMGLFRYGEN